MRDGTELPTDIYLPYPDAKGLPCVVIRTPSGKHLYHDIYVPPLTKQGYIVAYQDTRSYLDKQGKTFPYVTDGWGQYQDGYDTIEWLAKSPLTNGQIATTGFSAMGITQLLVAPTVPPHLKCQHISWAASSLYHHGITYGGQFYKSQIEGWLGMYANDPSVKNYVTSQPDYNAFWTSLDANALAAKVNVPALHYGGWYDTFSQGTIDGYLARQLKGDQGARGNQKLIMGPWVHPYTKVAFEFPENSKQPPYDISAATWFNYHIKGESNGIDKLPNVIYYVMGPLDGSKSSGNVWRTADAWPIPSDPTPIFLAAEGKLSFVRPEDESTIGFKYNPEKPVPTIGGRNLFLLSGPADQTPLESMEDVVVYTSDKLDKEIEVTGRVVAAIYFSSNQPQTDVAIRVTDVYPDGRSILIVDGIRTLKNYKPNTIVPVDIDLWSTSYVFAKDHKIRVSVSTTNYPRFEKPALASENTVYAGPRHPSHVVLPIVTR